MTYIIKDVLQNKVCEQPRCGVTFVVRSIVELTDQFPWKWLVNASNDVNQGTQNKICIVGIV